MPIPPYQVFVLLSCCNYLVAEFFRVYAHAASEGHPEGFEGVSGLDELLFLDLGSSLDLGSLNCSKHSNDYFHQHVQVLK